MELLNKEKLFLLVSVIFTADIQQSSMCCCSFPYKEKGFSVLHITF